MRTSFTQLSSPGSQSSATHCAKWLLLVKEPGLKETFQVLKVNFGI